MKRKIRRLAVPALIAVLFGSVLAALVCRLSPTSAAPDNYAQTVEPGGALEAKYLAKGAFRVARFESPAPNGMGRFVAYYPKVLEKGANKFPAVVFVNGAGVKASDYAAVFKRMASRGIVAIGNDDSGPLSGASTDATAAFLLTQNDDPSSVFFRRIDAGRNALEQLGRAIFGNMHEDVHLERPGCGGRRCVRERRRPVDALAGDVRRDSGA